MYTLNKHNNDFQPKNDYGFYSINPSSTSMCAYKVIIVN